MMAPCSPSFFPQAQVDWLLGQFISAVQDLRLWLPRNPRCPRILREGRQTPSPPYLVKLWITSFLVATLFPSLYGIWGSHDLRYSWKCKYKKFRERTQHQASLSWPRGHQSWAPQLRQHPRKKLTPQLPPCSVQIPVCFPFVGLCRRPLNLPTVPCHLHFCSLLVMGPELERWWQSTALILAQPLLTSFGKSPSRQTAFTYLLWGPLVERLSRVLFSQPHGHSGGSDFRVPHPPQGASHWPWGIRAMARLKICTQETMTKIIKASEALSGPGSISARACDGGGEKEPLGGSNFSSKEATVLIQKKNFFFQKRLWVNLSCPQLPGGTVNLLRSRFCGFPSNPNFCVH